MGNICVIGPRGSGKTTYLAALAYKNRTMGKSNFFKIIPLNDDSRKLAEKAENIICYGESLEPTVIGQEIQTVDDLPYYSFNLEIKKHWLANQESFQLNVRDYPGEVFEKIADPTISDNIYEEFINECLMKDVGGCLILLTAWDKADDSFYSQVMSRFIKLMDSHGRTNDLRLAVAMSKCERGELWPGRLDPETDLFGLHLPRTRAILRDNIAPQNIRFYAISTFGVLRRTDPRPNRTNEQGKSGKASVLREAPRWQPYNMIEPLYWLGKTTKAKGKVK
jgi:hypothetical protein